MGQKKPKARKNKRKNSDNEAKKTVSQTLLAISITTFQQWENKNHSFSKKILSFVSQSPLPFFPGSYDAQVCSPWHNCLTCNVSKCNFLIYNH